MIAVNYENVGIWHNIQENPLLIFRGVLCIWQRYRSLTIQNKSLLRIHGKKVNILILFRCTSYSNVQDECGRVILLATLITLENDPFVLYGMTK